MHFTLSHEFYAIIIVRLFPVVNNILLPFYDKKRMILRNMSVIFRQMCTALGAYLNKKTLRSCFFYCQAYAFACFSGTNSPILLFIFRPLKTYSVHFGSLFLSFIHKNEFLHGFQFIFSVLLNKECFILQG